MKNLFNTITNQEILKKTSNGVKIGDRYLSKEEASSYVNQANTILALPLWDTLRNQIRWVSNERMYNKSQSNDDIIFGKATLYTLDILENKLNEIANWNK